MTTIWKTALKGAGRQFIEIPTGAEILSAREQHGQICVWYRCDPAAPKALRDIAIAGTGTADAPPLGNSWRFLGTASLHDGQFIFHIFERL